VALWIFTQTTIEDTARNTMHAPGCPALDPETATDVHAAGSSVRRDVALRECRRCRPGLELRLGV
jgi:hypothetical protein